MTLSRRRTLALIGGGVILAASASLGAIASRQPRTALLPWGQAGLGEDARHRALSWALLAPNPHNRQPWLVDLATPGEVVLYVDTAKLLPHTDPYNRQITIGLGCFLELMRMAASHDGQRVEITPFPQGYDDRALDARPVARAVFTEEAGVTPDPLFAQALARRSTKEPYDTARPLPGGTLERLAVARTARFGGTLDPKEVADWRAFTHEALRIEIETPNTYKESVDLFRIGRAEVDANPDGIDFTGPLFEVLGTTGLMTRESVLDPSSQAYKAGLDAVYANTDTAMGHVWLVTDGNSRPDQIATGADWLRVNLAATAAGVAFQPLSQALQEYPEMAKPYADLHARLAPTGGTVQMLARIGYGSEVAPSPRWPLEAKILNG
ncbi:Acg family FMN-binding oxidoreductase [Rhodobacter sp. SY28-1]|uniref:Acg family FMN-binding oxidoreductase n=1 Tax=Rhodobacter sp. SY28-1 TaxID=2562317 RepID=UPI001F101C03|nr:twin-arginine translocation pathway signal protein [Rhodobacter sp. SY28-1]